MRSMSQWNWNWVCIGELSKKTQFASIWYAQSIVCRLFFIVYFQPTTGWLFLSKSNLHSIFISSIHIWRNKLIIQQKKFASVIKICEIVQDFRDLVADEKKMKATEWKIANHATTKSSNTKYSYQLITMMILCIFLRWTYSHRKKKNETKQPTAKRSVHIVCSTYFHVNTSFSSSCNNICEEMNFQSEHAGYASIIQFFFSNDAACRLNVW